MKLELGYWVTDVRNLDGKGNTIISDYFSVKLYKMVTADLWRCSWAHCQVCFFLFTIRVLSSERQAQCEQNHYSSAAQSAKWVMELLPRRRVELDPGVGGWGSQVSVLQSRKHLGAKCRNCLLRSSDRSLWTGRSSVWFISNRYLLWKHRGRL